MKVHVSHPVFDIESEIIKTGNAPCPVDLKAFQQRIDRTCGKMPDGKSKVRIVWGQAATQFIMGRQRMKYPFYRYMDGGEIHDIGTPRFYLEELHTNAELQAQGRWDAARYADLDGERVDLLDRSPKKASTRRCSQSRIMTITAVVAVSSSRVNPASVRIVLPLTLTLHAFNGCTSGRSRRHGPSLNRARIRSQRRQPKRLITEMKSSVAISAKSSRILSKCGPTPGIRLIRRR